MGTDVDLPGASMKPDDAARTLLSGEHSRRRGYLTQAISTSNQLAIMGAVGIWSLVIDWNSTKDVFAVQISVAGGAVSLLLGFWRFYVRTLDDAIIKLYPSIYFLERAVMPAELCTIDPPANVPAITVDDPQVSLDFVTVENVFFGSRGHAVFDTVGLALPVLFAVLSTGYAWSNKLVTFQPARWPHVHVVGWLVLFNLAGLLVVLRSLYLWPRNCVTWPVPKGKKSDAEQALKQRLKVLRGQRRPWAWCDVKPVRPTRLDRAGT